MSDGHGPGLHGPGVDGPGPNGPRSKIAVVGTGISGMAAAWLLSQAHDVTVYERADRIGGHSNTVRTPPKHGGVPVDTGFIVYNETTYPNLTALFRHLDVPTLPTDMSLAVSLDEGALEYGGGSFAALLAQKRNLLRPRFWSMLAGLVRFYRRAPGDVGGLDEVHVTLGDYLKREGYSRAFRDDHLLPMAGAIWSAAPQEMLEYPAAAFIRFHENHGLLKFVDRPVWRTVAGGSATYVERLTRGFRDKIRLDRGVAAITRTGSGVTVTDDTGATESFDHVVIATHADQALGMLADPTLDERALLGAFRYTRNVAVLHTDDSLMPKRRAAWSSWNVIGTRTGPDDKPRVTVTYWMNTLQHLPAETPLFVTLNPPRPPRPGTLIQTEIYEHPLFDLAACAAQRQLWSLQGTGNTWYCGAHFGAGFHEDGLQAGLAVAEAIGGVRRPWTVPNESGRIPLDRTRVRVPQPTLPA
ncbi:NAD/FAD-binding protein [Rhodoplanes elegans]|uniref:NAD/FAD-binding protein n=2 Tax=Rhodoplanes elegans TaxID=29408 RepID=A0A327KCI5_9BRAD|nr:FAD-dependent oxidoreductase [Rhodoplanes elegans]MBK5956876.1 NAD/FAD-binding protein [Rhodoplanes elegans]RAI36499.1 NAD/FAD-binding protein [Rhodoplanes elegans]